YFMLGHSMGSFLARTYLIRHPGTLDGCILSGTGQEPPFTVALGKALAGHLAKSKGSKYVSSFLTKLSLGGYNKKFAPNRTGSDWISRDLTVVDTYVADPLCRFVPTVGMFRDMMGGLQFIADKGNLAKMDPATPIYLMSGSKDPVGGMGAGVEKVLGFFQGAGVRDLTMKLYPEGRHEMLNETNRAEVYGDVHAWLERRIPG
ncbi:MAG: alpha/beta hydrolase, partial [Pseudoflavonifractor sp.]